VGSTNLYSQTKNQTINVAEVAAKVDLVTLALEYGLDLIPQNNGDYVCFCPFHDDNETPSMRIYSATGTFYCFGCQAGASVFEFVMRMDNIEFKDALAKLAERVGYDGTFVLRDLSLQNSDDSFVTIRERIETELLYKAKQVYRHLRAINIPLKVLYSSFEELWKWYDQSQYSFDKKLFDGYDSKLLIAKLYEFYEVFFETIG